MPEHRKTISNSLPVGQQAAVARITPGVTADRQALDHVGRKTQRVTSRSLNARDEFILSRAFSLGHHRNFWISALLIQSPNLAGRPEWARCPLISLPSGNQTACRDSLLRDRESVTPVVLTSLVINVTSPTASFSLSSSQIVLSGELTAARVIFNFPGTEGMLNIFKSDTIFRGTLLVPHRPENSVEG